jgi:hypothetical protein
MMIAPMPSGLAAVGPGIPTIDVRNLHAASFSQTLATSTVAKTGAS